MRGKEIASKITRTWIILDISGNTFSLYTDEAKDLSELILGTQVNSKFWEVSEYAHHKKFTLKEEKKEIDGTSLNST